MKLYVLLIILFAPVALSPVSAVQAGGGVTRTGSVIQTIEKVVNGYHRAAAVSMKVNKTIKSEFIGEKKSSGEMYFSKGRLRMEITNPESVLMVADKNHIWLATPLGFDGKIQVTKINLKPPPAKTSGSKVNKKNNGKRTNALLALLFGEPSVWQDFEVISSHNKRGQFESVLAPKSSARLPEVAKVALTIDNSKKQILEMTYWDDLDNQTTYSFSDINLSAKVAKSQFSYVPPKNAEVTEY